MYVFSCLCGRKFRTVAGGSFRCPNCDRLVLVDWKAAVVKDVGAIAGEEAGGLPATVVSAEHDPI
jgi:DNA-directed RNA polymerase subunit RPC12/RpoP